MKYKTCNIEEETKKTLTESEENDTGTEEIIADPDEGKSVPEILTEPEQT